MEVKTPIFKRVSTGDRWTEVDGDGSRVFPSLTDALEFYFQKTKSRQYFIDAVAGTISSVREENDPIPELPMYSIYGDY